MFCSSSSSAGGSNILGFAGTPCVYMQYHLEFLFKITLGKKKKIYILLWILPIIYKTMQRKFRIVNMTRKPENICCFLFADYLNVEILQTKSTLQLGQVWWWVQPLHIKRVWQRIFWQKLTPLWHSGFSGKDNVCHIGREGGLQWTYWRNLTHYEGWCPYSLEVLY